MSKFTLFITSVLFLCSPVFAQEKPPVTAVRIQVPPKIDGRLEDSCWKKGIIYSHFIQSAPEFGIEPVNKTEVIVLYDDEAVYVAAKCFMDPDSIWMQLTKRDEVLDFSDGFAFAFDTYRDGQNAFGFGVSPRNVQSDFKLFLNSNDDATWDAVWDSKVIIVNDGWQAEIKIPYSAIRFPKVEVQEWNIDFYRIVRMSRREYHSAGVNPEENGLVSQFQPLIGVSDIEPPLRLSLSPYATLYDNIYSDPKSDTVINDVNFKGGMDLKWGISESFTLDAILVPDFGQVQSDNIVYNITAFEVQYDENRPFFTEGTELFNKSELFYSRRIGFTSDYYQTHNDTNVTLLSYPVTSRLLNATKISGRTSEGLGIGFFNAVTANNYTDARNAEGDTIEVLVDPVTNYNVIVFDQSIKNNGYVTFTNSNVIRDAGGRDANVANLMAYVPDKKQKYAGFAYAAWSMLTNQESEKSSVDFTHGYLYKLSFEKISGNLTFNLSHLAISPDYNINDLGFLTIRNQNIEQLNIFYDIYEPFGKFNSFHTENFIQYEYRHNNGAYQGAYINGFTLFTERHYNGFFSYYFAAPFGFHDYYEPRVEGRYYDEPAVYELGLGISTDYRKHVALDIEGGPSIWNEPGRIKYRWLIAPRFRIGDRLFFIPSNHTHLYQNSIGYVDIDAASNIIFGRRNIQEYDNSVTGSYIFNSNMSLALKLRYYTQKGTYDQFYVLQEDGSLGPSSYNENSDFNFNAWNIDLGLTWWFLPGSEINIVWKNSITGFDDQADLSFVDNLDHTFDYPQNNNFSIRVRYYLDYQDVRKWVK